MAVIPRVAPVNTVAHIAGALAPAGLRNVAAVDRVPVEETGGSTATSLDSAIVTQAYGRRASDRPQDRRDRPEARAIDTYETATDAINGTNARGATVSFLL